MGYKLINYTINVKSNPSGTTAASAGFPQYYWSKILNAWADKFASFNNITKGTCSGDNADNYYCRFNNDTLGMYYYKTQSVSNYPHFGTRSSSSTNYQLTPLDRKFAPITGTLMTKQDFSKMKARYVIDDSTNDVIYFSPLYTNVYGEAANYDNGWSFLFLNDKFCYNNTVFTLGASPSTWGSVGMIGGLPMPEPENYNDVYVSNVMLYDNSTKKLEIADHLAVIQSLRVPKDPGEIITVNGRKYMFLFDITNNNTNNTQSKFWIPVDSVEEQSIDIES